MKKELGGVNRKSIRLGVFPSTQPIVKHLVFPLDRISIRIFCLVNSSIRGLRIFLVGCVMIMSISPESNFPLL